MDEKSLRARYNAAVRALEAADAAIDALPDDADADTIALAEQNHKDAVGEAERAKNSLDAHEARERARAAFKPLAEDGEENKRHAVAKGELRDEPVYRPGVRSSFFQDAFRATFQADSAAGERLARNRSQVLEGAEYRDVDTSAYGALVVPQYLTDLFAPYNHKGRPFANAVTSVPLPDKGMTLNIPRLTTGTATAIQATENAGVQETNLDETTLAVSVRTIAGQQDVSRQAIDRGEMIDTITFADLGGHYAQTLDTQIITADGTSGTILGVLNTSSINAITYTDASPTVGELYPKLLDGIQQVNTAVGGIGMWADLIVMHPRRWGWLCAAVDSQSRPLVVPNAQAPMNASGVGATAGYGEVGTLAGLPVVLDANIPTNLGGGTNEDRIIITSRRANLLFERPGDPSQLRFEQTGGGNLTVKLVLFGYAAFTAGRYPTATSVISGTGLATPTF